MLIEMENFSIGRSHAKGTALFLLTEAEVVFPHQHRQYPSLPIDYGSSGDDKRVCTSKESLAN